MNEMTHTGRLIDELKQVGIETRVQHFTGDSSFPTEYTLSLAEARSTAQPTLDMALVNFIQQYVKQTRNLLECLRDYINHDFAIMDSPAGEQHARMVLLERVKKIVGEE